MSYLVLARKYRPESFDEIVGQDHVVRTLKNAIRLDRVHHAFLLTGARGVGKTTTARVLARALNCEQGPTESPCGSCAACTEIRQGISPDVLEIDGASNTGVDNVRELRENVRYLPSRGRHKLYVIDEVHMLSQAAFNALLKTLEEPPAHVKFVFATTEPHKIPITILSRCQRFDFRRVSNQNLSDHLKHILKQEGVELGPTAIAAVVREAQGSVRDALSLLDQVLSYAGDRPADDQVVEALGVVDRETVFDICGAVFARDADKLLRLVAEVDARGHDLGEVSGLLVEHLRDLMVAKVVEEPGATLLDRAPGEIAALKNQAKALSRPDLHRLFRLAVGIAQDVARSPHPRVSLEMGLLRLLEVEPTENLESLIAKVDALLKADGGAGMASASAPSRSVKPREELRAPQSQAGATSVRDVRDVENLKDVEENEGWKRLVERVRGMRPAMASVLEHGRPVNFGPNGVEVGYTKGSFYWEQARDPEMRELLRKAVQDHFGQPVELSIRDVEGAGAHAPNSIAAASEAKRKQKEQAVRERAVEHPMVQTAVATLGGEIKKVTPLLREE